MFRTSLIEEEYFLEMGRLASKYIYVSDDDFIIDKATNDVHTLASFRQLIKRETGWNDITKIGDHGYPVKVNIVDDFIINNATVVDVITVSSSSEEIISISKKTAYNIAHKGDLETLNSIRALAVNNPFMYIRIFKYSADALLKDSTEIEIMRSNTHKLSYKRK